MRHGLSVMNKQGIFSGRNDTPLTKEGIFQCHQAAKDLKSIQINAIVTSPMKRALDSAKIIAEDIGYPIENIIISDLFVERSFGPLEGTTYTKNMDLDTTSGVEHSTSIIKRAQAGLDLIILNISYIINTKKLNKFNYLGIIKAFGFMIIKAWINSMS